MPTIVFFHGGDSYPSEAAYIDAVRAREIWYSEFDRKRWIASVEPWTNIKVLAPQMPSKENANYDLWSVVADKVFASLEGQYILMGHSLGGAFLLKYLAERPNLSPRKVLLVAPAFFPRSTWSPRPDGREPHASWYIDGQHVAVLRWLTAPVMIYQSEDDVIVPPDSVRELLWAVPNFLCKWFINRGHFNGSEFPEIIEDIKKEA